MKDYAGLRNSPIRQSFSPDWTGILKRLAFRFIRYYTTDISNKQVLNRKNDKFGKGDYHNEKDV